MAKKKWYAIKTGKQPGIYTQWSEAEAQVKGYPGAKFKSFPSEAEAKRWLEGKDDGQSAGSARKKSSGSSSKGRKGSSPSIETNENVLIYTDGGAINNPGPGGYGAVIQYGTNCGKKLAGKEKELTGGYRLTTNNRMELMACIVALKELETGDIPISLYSDSSYVVNGMSKGWARKWQKNGWLKSDKKPVLNQDLWTRLLELTDKLPITFHWVKGHSGNPMNERCDRLAVRSAKGKKLKIDKEYEKG